MKRQSSFIATFVANTRVAGLLVASLLVAAAFVAIGAARAEPGSVWIDDLTWPEIRDAIAAGKRTAIIYTGSSEQNGPTW
jgi:hypothetical protein